MIGRPPARCALASRRTLDPTKPLFGNGSTAAPRKPECRYAAVGSISPQEPDGKVNFKHVVEGENMREETDKVPGLTQRYIAQVVDSRARSTFIFASGTRALTASPLLSVHRHSQSGSRRCFSPARRTFADMQVCC